MKVYSLPKEVPAPKVDYRNYDRDKEMKREDEHKAALVAWLKKAGYTGKYTGEIVSFHVADGHAQYMIGDGKKFCLIHLPYGDAYSYYGVDYLPKKEIIRLADAEKNFHKLFAKK